MPEENDNAQDEEYEKLRRARAEEQQKQQQDSQIRAALKQILEPSAYERLSNLRLSKSDLYMRVVSLLVSLYQQGKLSSKVSDDQLRALLSKLISQKKETKITFERK